MNSANSAIESPRNSMAPDANPNPASAPAAEGEGRKKRQPRTMQHELVEVNEKAFGRIKDLLDSTLEQNKKVLDAMQFRPEVTALAKLLNELTPEEFGMVQMVIKSQLSMLNRLRA
jgi:hypothetical protein